MKKGFSIVLTGPESSGKTTLIQSLSEKWQWPYTVEVARDYLEKTTELYNETSLLEISKLQFQLIDSYNMEHSHFLCDTDLLTIVIWYIEKYGPLPSSLLDLFQSQLPNGYILCAPDIPWVFDPLRENPNDRERLYSLYEKWILDLQIPYVVVSGCLEERVEMASKFLNSTLLSHFIQ